MILFFLLLVFRWCITVVSPQNQFNAQVGTYNNFSHPIGGGQPPQLPTSPPTYESVSDRTSPATHLSCSQQMDRPTGWGPDTQGRAVCSVCLQFYVLFAFQTHIRSRLALCCGICLLTGSFWLRLNWKSTKNTLKQSRLAKKLRRFCVTHFLWWLPPLWTSFLWYLLAVMSL